MAVAMLLATVTFAQGYPQKTLGAKTDKWVKVASKYNDSFFTTDEARRIGDNVLLYQQTTGGWPKNVKMQEPLDSAEKAAVAGEKTNVNESTIDNGATTTEIIYLARLYNATKERKYLDAFMGGMDYLFRSQYDNGGWPQFWPRPKGYYTHITYNDDAMVNVLKIMRDVAKGKKPFAFVPDSTRAKAKVALDKGVDCILKTQVRQNGKLTVWCAQHDEHTLLPAKARAYELASLSGQESDGIVLFLMSLSKPSEAMKQCIEAAVEWFRTSMITGMKMEHFTNSDGKPDRRLVKCGEGEQCEPLWGRFYTLDTNRPFVCDRDGQPKYDISEIGYERRNGYSWYNNGGLWVFKEYEEWKREKAGRQSVRNIIAQQP